MDIDRFPFMRIIIILCIEIMDRNFVQKSKPIDRLFFFLVFCVIEFAANSHPILEGN